jgi:hypothetical protein
MIANGTSPDAVTNSSDLRSNILTSTTVQANEKFIFFPVLTSFSFICLNSESGVCVLCIQNITTWHRLD